jgi:hypothetical protein
MSAKTKYQEGPKAGEIRAQYECAPQCVRDGTCREDREEKEKRQVSGPSLPRLDARSRCQIA